MIVELILHKDMRCSTISILTTLAALCIAFELEVWPFGGYYYVPARTGTSASGFALSGICLDGAWQGLGPMAIA